MQRRSRDGSSEEQAGHHEVSPANSGMVLRRRDFLGLFFAVAVPVAAQRADPLFEVVTVNHINIRVSNPTRSAHFYQGLFGGELGWIESIPPNPESPSAESWFLSLGQQYLSITPTFPNLKLGPGLDHICPALRGYEPTSAAINLNQRDIQPMASPEVWIRDPDRMIYQLRSAAIASKPGAPPGGAKPKAADISAPGPAPFAPVGVRELVLRVADLNKTAEFCRTVFGGEIESLASDDAKTFKFGDCVLRLIPRAASGASSSLGMDRLAIAVKDFSAGSTRSALSQLGINSRDNGRPGEVHFGDPDGIHVQLVSSVPR